MLHCLTELFVEVLGESFNVLALLVRVLQLSHQCFVLGFVGLLDFVHVGEAFEGKT